MPCTSGAKSRCLKPAPGKDRGSIWLKTPSAEFECQCVVNLAKESDSAHLRHNEHFERWQGPMSHLERAHQGQLAEEWLSSFEVLHVCWVDTSTFFLYLHTILAIASEVLARTQEIHPRNGKENKKRGLRRTLEQGSCPSHRVREARLSRSKSDRDFSHQARVFLPCQTGYFDGGFGKFPSSNSLTGRMRALCLLLWVLFKKLMLLEVWLVLIVP